MKENVNLIYYLQSSHVARSASFLDLFQRLFSHHHGSSEDRDRAITIREINKNLNKFSFFSITAKQMTRRRFFYDIAQLKALVNLHEIKTLASSTRFHSHYLVCAIKTFNIWWTVCQSLAVLDEGWRPTTLSNFERVCMQIRAVEWYGGKSKEFFIFLKWMR